MRPYQHPGARLLARGSAVLTDAELLAIILRTGSGGESALHLAARVLASFDGLDAFARASAAELQTVQDLTIDKAAQIIAALELSRRLLAARSAERPIIATTDEAARFVADMAFLDQEHIRVVLLDTNRRVIAAPTLYKGTLNTSVLRVSEVFREAITHNSPALILAHNHPSGDPTPSPQDVEVTRALATAGHLLDITLIDHLIIGHGRWVSLRDQGFLP
jgi:DNA repair protein RadC